MKQFLYSLFLLFAVLSMACSDNNDKKANNRPLSVSKQSLTFSAVGGEQTFYVQCGRDYEVTSAHPEWCVVEADGEHFTGLDQYLVSLAFNPSTAVRTSSITITDGLDTYQVTVTQEGGNFPDPDPTGMSHTAMELLHSIRKGWNLYNTLEASGGETAWGQPLTTQAVINHAKAHGFNGIRIPCAWNQYVTDGTTSDIKPEWMARVKEVVDYCMNAGVYAILNIHWDGGWLENDIPNGYNEAIEEKQRSFWKQIATTFRDYDEHLIFASANEPNADTLEQWETLRKYHQACIDAVRTTGGRNLYRTIIIQAPRTDIDLAVKLVDRLPNDPTPDRLGIEVHYYTPAPFCLLDEDGAWGGVMCQWFWGEEQDKYATSDFSGRWQKENNEPYVREQFRKMYDTFVSKGYPVLMGEYGMIRRTLTDSSAQEGHDNSCRAFVRTVTSEAKAHGCTPCYWGGTFNRLSGEITDTPVGEGLEEGAQTEYLSFKNNMNR